MRFTLFHRDLFAKIKDFSNEGALEQFINKMVSDGKDISGLVVADEKVPMMTYPAKTWANGEKR